MKKETLKELIKNWDEKTNEEYIQSDFGEEETMPSLTKANFEKCLTLPWCGSVDAAQVTLWEGAGDGSIELDYRPTPKKAVKILKDHFEITKDDDFYPYLTVTVKYENPDNGKTEFKTYGFDLEEV